jgi:hypothetical protein
VSAAEAQSSRRVFEPERPARAVPAEFELEDFSDREIGILVDQGNFERARVLLAKRSALRSDDAEVYFDAIRMETSATPGAQSWQAWVSRALRSGAQVAGRLPALIEQGALCAYLVQQDVGWAALEAQRDQAGARELMRMRLERQLVTDPLAALAAIEEPALSRAAIEDAALLQLALGVMAAAVWRDPARVSALAPRYGVELEREASAGLPVTGDPRQLLRKGRELQRFFELSSEAEPWPEPLERVVRAGALVSAATAARLLAELRADLQVRPRDYQRCAEAIARVSSALCVWLQQLFTVAVIELDAGNAEPERAETDAAQKLAQRLVEAGRALRRDPLARSWWVGLGAVAAGAVIGWLELGGIGVATAGVACGAFLALRRPLDALLYRRHLRTPLMRSIVLASGEGVASLAERIRNSAIPLRRSMARCAGRDPALALLGAIVARDR